MLSLAFISRCCTLVRDSPEACNDGGILETYQMAVLADSYGLRMAPHGWAGPAAVRAATHVRAVIPNLLPQEFPGSRPGHAWTQELIDPPAEVRDGKLVVPEGPGLARGLAWTKRRSRRSASAEGGQTASPNYKMGV